MTLEPPRPLPPKAGLTPEVRRRVLLLVMLTVFLDMVGFGLVMPLLPLYVKSMNATPFMVGVILSFFSVAQLIATPILGKLSDKYGRRKVILISLVGNAISMVVFAIATTLHLLPLFFVSRLIAGATAGNLSACQAVIADVTIKQERAGAMGRLGAGIGLGMVVGPVVGGWLGAVSPWAPPIAAAAMAMLDVILTGLWMPETRWLRESAEAQTKPTLESEMPKPSLWIVLRERRMLAVLVLFFLTFLSITNIQVALALLANERMGWTQAEVGSAFGVFGGVTLLVQGVLLSRLVKLVGELNLVILGAFFNIAGMVTIAVAGQSIVLVGGLLLFGFGVSVTNPLLSTIASQLARDDQQGAVLGFAQSAGTFGRTIGPTWSGFLFTQFGSAMPFLSGAVAASISVFVGLSLKIWGKAQPLGGADAPVKPPAP